MVASKDRVESRLYTGWEYNTMKCTMIYFIGALCLYIDRNFAISPHTFPHLHPQHDHYELPSSQSQSSVTSAGCPSARYHIVAIFILDFYKEMIRLMRRI